MKRGAVLALFSVLALFWAGVLVATWGTPWCIFGWNLGPDGTTLTYVAPSRPADRAGIRAGDRIEWSSLPLLGRANLGLIQTVLPDARLHVTVHRGAQARTLTLTPEPLPRITQNSQNLGSVAALILMTIGIVLVRLRPSRMTWGFLLASAYWAQPDYLRMLAQTGAAKFLVVNGTESLLGGAAAAGILIFMSRFPGDSARGRVARAIDRVAIPFGVAVTALGLFIDVAAVISPSPPPAWTVFLSEYGIKALLVLVALGTLLSAYAITRGSERQRMVPVLVAFAAYVASSVAYNVYVALFTGGVLGVAMAIGTVCAMLALAVAVAHGVIRHRVFDVSFAISRTVVYTLLTSIVVGVFVMIDFLSSKILDRLQLAIVLEAAAAMAFGIWLNALHSRIDQLVDRVLFRRRHLAEARLQRSARTLPHAEAAAFIDDALVADACEALSIASAAVFRRDGSGGFGRTNSRGWNDEQLQQIPRSDRLIMELLAELEAVDLPDVRWNHCDVPAGVGQPILALPFVVRHDVLGFVLYSGHVGGEGIDPDERRLLAELATAAAAAYDHVESKALQAQASELRAENAMLVREERLLREMIDALRNVSAASRARPQ